MMKTQTYSFENVLTVKPYKLLCLIQLGDSNLAGDWLLMYVAVLTNAFVKLLVKT